MSFSIYFTLVLTFIILISYIMVCYLNYNDEKDINNKNYIDKSPKKSNITNQLKPDKH